MSFGLHLGRCGRKRPGDQPDLDIRVSVEFTLPGLIPLITRLGTTLVATLQEVRDALAAQSTKLDELGRKIDSDEAQDEAVIAELKGQRQALTDENARLQAIIDAGGLDQATVDELAATIAANGEKLAGLEAKLRESSADDTPPVG